MRRLRALLMATALALPGMALSAERAGEATRAQQNAFQWVNIAPGQLDTGDEIFRNAEVYTKDHGSVEMRMDDDSVLILGPNSEVVIDEFVYAPDGDGNAALRLGKGVLRMISGRLGAGQVTIGTPVAHIGIRGTTFTLSTRRPGLLDIWLTEGILVITPLASSQSFELVAPTFATCDIDTCTQDTARSTPTFFPIAPPRNDDPDDRGGGNDSDNNSGGNTGGFN